MARRIAVSRRWVAVAMCGLSLSALAAQDQPGTRFRTEANYVRVDVYASRNGVPVLDLGPGDFEVTEDRAPQKIEQFAHVTTADNRGLAVGAQPTSVAAGREAAAEARARVFVLFLDLPHVDAGTSRQFRDPLIAMLRRLVGATDLIAVMTPDMRGRDLAFARGADQVEQMLSGAWGARDDSPYRDETERRYATCYPGIPKPGAVLAADQGIAQEMILRHREERTLGALLDLAHSLRDLREERKAIIAITDGWLLYGPNSALARPIDRGVPTAGDVGIDRSTGKLTTTNVATNAPTPQCEVDRLSLSQLNDQRTFRDVIDAANRANASYYPIDPRGVTAFDDDPIPVAGVGAGPLANPSLSPSEDRARLTGRASALKTLAEGTDGLAVVGTAGVRRYVERMASDLSSYYLLGYYSTGKLDGKFHAINVRVKQQGVDVRARRGYLALSATAAQPTTKAPLPADAVTQAVAGAIGALATTARDTAMYVRGASGWGATGAPVFWADVELGRTGQPSGSLGGTSTASEQVDASLVNGAGQSVVSTRVTIPTGAPSARVTLEAPGAAPGEYQLMLRTRSGSIQTITLQLLPGPRGTGTLLNRSGPATASRDVPAADVRFRRSDRISVHLPASSSETPAAHLLDRTGTALAIPVTATLRSNPDGSRWITAQLALAPLAAGDYVIEITSGSERALTAFRVVP